MLDLVDWKRFENLILWFRSYCYWMSWINNKYLYVIASRSTGLPSVNTAWRAAFVARYIARISFPSTRIPNIPRAVARDTWKEKQNNTAWLDLYVSFVELNGNWNEPNIIFCSQSTSACFSSEFTKLQSRIWDMNLTKKFSVIIHHKIGNVCDFHYHISRRKSKSGILSLSFFHAFLYDITKSPPLSPFINMS